ncbi:hypothetical protein GOP47_0015793 [Adiantum capillus-veneris]|uniref:Uncharacterized protein n=1 Tax=Adiantum capillus-veneris TaxID=13818 RepID=A0A9D4UL46_ADICA|nr:hypothetical protein GOP47_0015793 [Adiantum capillus-veneris]
MAAPTHAQEFTPVLKSKVKQQELHNSFSENCDLYKVTSIVHSFSSGKGQRAVQHCKKENPSGKTQLTITEIGHTSPQNAGNYKPEEGCEARDINHSIVRQELTKESSPDKIIEHYWISVGKEHMRAMHSKSTKDTQPKSPSALKVHAGASSSGLRGGKVGYKSLIEKVEQCEDELQRLTLRLQAQQCKKPWFLEAARKSKVYQRETRDAGASDNSLQASGSTSSLGQVCAHIKKSIDRSKESVIGVFSAHTFAESISQESKGSSLDLVQEAPCENLPVSIEGSEQLLDTFETPTYIGETHTLETQPASDLSVLEHNELQEPNHHEDPKKTQFCGHGSDHRDEPDPSVCSKSSSESYQHSRSSGDSRSNASQEVSACAALRRRPCSTLTQQRRRGGKIDRVARFAEMQKLWKKDAFLVASEAGGKRKGVQSFHHHFSTLHSTSSY